MKNLTKLLLLLALLLPATAIAYDFEVDGIYYNIINGNEASVTSSPTSSKYTGDVTIPSLVTYNGTTYSVTTIGVSAFFECSGLTNVDIPNSVTRIDYWAFYGCSGLTSITIPNSVTSNSWEAFVGCSGLKQLIWNAKNCSHNGDIPTSNIEQVTIGAEVEIIPDRFVSGSKITEIDIPSSVTSIGSNAFSSCTGLTSITIPNSVTAIGNSAFSSCTGLTSITIPNSVTAIGNSAFSSCNSLAHITIPTSVASIGMSAFEGTGWLSNQPNGLVYAGLVAYIFKGDMPDGTSITLRTGTLGIAGSAFYGCSGLTRIDIPNSVTNINANAFYGCSGLTRIDIPNSVTTIGDEAFSYCGGLKEVYCHINNPQSVYFLGNPFYLSDSWRYALRTLYIPTGSLASYTSSAWYNYFGSFIEMDEGGIITAFELDNTAAVVIEGETLQLNAFITPEDATNKTLAWASSKPDVATVDENGLVTGVSVGSATITAMTTDGSNLSASCQVTVKSLSTENCFSMPDCEVLHGESITIPIQLNNTESIMAFQTDLYLPEGFTLVTDEDGEPIVTPSSRLTSDHIIMAEYLNDGGVRVLCYNASEQIISGNEGDLFYIMVNAPDDAAGDYAIYLRNSRLTNMDYNEIRIPDVGAVLTVNTFIPGDVNDSHNVNVTDIVVAAQYVLQRNPSPFIFEAADMNGDGEVTVTDIMLIARLILYPTMMNAPRQAPAIATNYDRMSGESILLQTGETQKVIIALDNEMDYAAFQLDLNLPDGLMANNFELTDRAASHAFDVEAIGNGKTRVLCYSPTIEAIAGNSGALLTFDVIALAPIAGDITVDGIEMVTTTCQPVLHDAFAIGVNTQTAVNELTTGKTIARVDYYNVAGQRVDRPESGVTLVVTTYTDGTRTTTKLIH